ncbi:MAG: DUF6931 family protein [Steroidobacteraceae bacterium]|jgi:hypothetical protein
MVGTFTKLAVSDVATLMSRAVLPPEAQTTLQGCTDVGDALDRLQAAGFAFEAVRMLAHALPKREGVWWACMCASNTAPRDLSDDDELALENAEQWVRQQKDALRREAMVHAEHGGFTTAEAWTGVAAFWSGDTLAPPGEREIPPLPEQTGTAVAAAVTLASVRGDGKQYAERLQRFLDSGRNILSGGTGRMPAETN